MTVSGFLNHALQLDEDYLIAEEKTETVGLIAQN